VAWDPSLLKKFNSVSHFHLLKQLRSELKDKPLAPREGRTRPADETRSATGSRMRRAAGNSGRRATGREGERAGKSGPPGSGSLGSAGNPSSFRDRLNAIDMR